MAKYWLLAALAAGSIWLPAAALAQRSQIQQPQLRDDEQILPSQIVQPPPKGKITKPAAATSADTDAGTAGGSAKPSLASLPPAAKAEPSRAVACSGNFAKTAGHLKLANVYGLSNVEWGQVSAIDGSEIPATVLFPKDPKRRLEVLWDDQTTRTGTSLIVITGQSTWTAPKGLHLGLPLAALEKLNGKPFRLKGFDKFDKAQVSDWDGGALTMLGGDCKIGVSLKPDGKASADARAALTADKEFSSDAPELKAVKPTVAEIILGY
jgi:hypothetical protein